MDYENMTYTPTTNPFTQTLQTVQNKALCSCLHALPNRNNRTLQTNRPPQLVERRNKQIIKLRANRTSHGDFLPTNKHLLITKWDEVVTSDLPQSRTLDNEKKWNVNRQPRNQLTQ